MKVCSKCKRQLPEVCFVNSPRHSGGLYPSCNTCRNEVRKRWVEKQEVCTRCKSAPRMKSFPWCQACRRAYQGKPPTPKFKRRPNTSDPNFCSRCGIRPPRDYNAWCQPCSTEHNRQWRRSKAAAVMEARPERKRKKTARHYINTLFKRGKFSRGPCYLCGEPSLHFHHLSYEDRSRNVIDLCHSCHVLVHRALRKLLTVST